MNKDYYQNLHETNSAYQNNNWLLPYIDHILKFEGDTILEIGCGNGKFTSIIQNYYSRAIGLDFAKSPLLDPSIEFIQCDALKYDYSDIDIVCSADVLEHFDGDQLDILLTNIINNVKDHFHVIACYDDHHSHQTVMTPEKWIELFSEFGEFHYYPSQNSKGYPILIVSTLKFDVDTKRNIP